MAGDWPDPMQQTLVDLAGKGVATLYVNGKKYGPVTLGVDKASICRYRSETILEQHPDSFCAKGKLA